jgi:hypothetical protein
MGIKINVGSTVQTAEIDDGAITNAKVASNAGIVKTKLASVGTNGRLLKADTTNNIVDATNTDTDVADAVTKKHSQNTDSTLILSKPSQNQTAVGKKLLNEHANAALAKGDLIYKMSTGRWAKANADTSAPLRCRGLCLTTATNQDDHIDVLLCGLYRDDDRYDFDAGDEIYLGETAGTEIEPESIPTHSGDLIQEIGWAYDADTLYFDPKLPVTIA